MKTSFKFLPLLLSALVFAGCATGKCNKNAGCTDCAGSYVPPAEAATSVQAAPTVAAPVPEPVADEIPAATRKYVNK